MVASFLISISRIQKLLYILYKVGFDLAGDAFLLPHARDSNYNDNDNLLFQDMTSRPKCAAAAKPMEVESNQYTVNSKIPVIHDLKKKWKQKKRWRSNQISVKKGSENYDLSLYNYYSQMRAAIGPRGDTEKFLKGTCITMDKLAEAWGIRLNKSRKTHQKLYNQ